MGKYLRPDVPGGVFHIATRVQGHAHLFSAPLRDRIVQLIARTAERSDARVLGFVVMTNHLHLVLLQGTERLDRFMQPFLRSVALVVNHAYGTEGHAFERRYRGRHCQDIEHVRSSVLYTHLNPVKAGLCKRPEDYRWSTHALYLGRSHPEWARAVDIAGGLRRFSGDDLSELREARSAYAAAMEAAMLRRAAPGTGIDGEAEADASLPSGPEEAGRFELVGDLLPSDCTRPEAVLSSPSLEEIAHQVLATTEAPHSLAQLRTRWGSRERLGTRRQIVFAAARHGYTGREIARFLEVSEPTVSRILTGAGYGGGGRRTTPAPRVRIPPHPAN